MTGNGNGRVNTYLRPGNEIVIISKYISTRFDRKIAMIHPIVVVWRVIFNKHIFIEDELLHRKYESCIFQQRNISVGRNITPKHYWSTEMILWSIKYMLWPLLSNWNLYLSCYGMLYMTQYEYCFLVLIQNWLRHSQVSVRMGLAHYG